MKVSITLIFNICCLFGATKVHTTNAEASAVLKHSKRSELSLNPTSKSDISKLKNSTPFHTTEIEAKSNVDSILQNKSLKLAGLFVLWYGFNAAYNVYNAFIKRDFQYPWATSTLQLFVGLFYVAPLWLFGLRKAPKLSFNDLKQIFPIAVLNALGHASTVNAMFEKGGGSFTHVIKASEPVVSVFLNLIVLKIVPKPLTAASLLPITYGVAYASTLGQLDAKTMASELTTKAAK